MNRMILNLYWRWWWIYAPAMLILGTVAGCSVNSKSGQQVFSSLMLQAAVFTGCFTLSMDLQRGIARALLALPLTAKQIGKTAWIAGVLIPSVALAIVVTMGVTIGAMVKHQPVEHPGFYALLWLLCASWQGASFYLLSEMNPANARSVRGMVAGALWGLSFAGCFWLAQVIRMDEPSLPLLGAIGIGVLLSLLGWLRAEDLILQRVSFRQGAQIGNAKPGQFHAPSGFGGVPFLWQTLVIRVFYMMLLIAAYFILMQVIFGAMKRVPLTPENLANAISPSLVSFGYMFTFFWLLMPMLMSLRSLRSLPISTPQLAATLVFFPVVTNLAMAGALALTCHTPVVLFKMFPVSALFALTVPLILRSGGGMAMFALSVFLVMAGYTTTEIIGLKIPMNSMTACVSLLIVFISWLLACRELQRSSRAYQFRMPTTTGMGWR